MNKENYAAWIRASRGKTGQEKFGQTICHYRVRDGRKVCAHYHRNEVGNWEKGKNLPMNTETVLSIALFTYDRQYGPPEREEERNRRLVSAQEKLSEFLGIDLYCRNLFDALMIQVCRGILTFEQVPELEAELESEINGPDAPAWSDRQLKEASLRRETESIRNTLYGIRSKEEIKRAVLSSRIFFRTATRTLGERLEETFYKRKRYPAKISLESAVYLYAPNNRQTYRRIYQSAGITRDWLLDLCFHLRFDRQETNYVLRNAHMAELSEDTKAGPLEAEAESIDAHYESFARRPIGERLRIMVLLASQVFLLEPEEFPPADYLLESFSHNEQGKRAMTFLSSLLEEADPGREGEFRKLEERLTGSEDFQDWTHYLLSGRDYARKEGLQTVFEAYKDEHREYFRPYYSPQADPAVRREIATLHYLTALFYTVLTGKYYRGAYTQADQLSLERQFMKAGPAYRYTGRFFDQILRTFLSPGITRNRKRVRDGSRWKEEAFYCICDRNGRRLTKEVIGAEIRENLWETVLAAK